MSTRGLEEHFLGVHLTGIQVRIEIPDIPVIDEIQGVVRGPGIKAGQQETSPARARDTASLPNVE